MKTIALLPVKNEEWILPTYIYSMKQVADEIIALDDNSTDNTKQILKDNGVFVLENKDTNSVVNMSKKRSLLLEQGRKRGGTHFIWLDADEIFDNDFIKNFRKYIEKLEPGQKLILPWITLWKSVDKERVDGIWKNNYKDVIVYDKPELVFEDKDLSEGRSQGDNNNLIKLNRKEGTILHFQFVNFEDAQAKQAWYRCLELIQSKRNPKKINNMYGVSLDNQKVRTKSISKELLANIKSPNKFGTKRDKYISEILTIFNKYGVKFFEPLDIWYIKELKDIFIKEVGREPKVKNFPSWLIRLNNLKNKIKNKYVQHKK